uniref:Uncharacterized protein n=1 Tax=Oryza glumipatula TaxID=40148 RepID=A0A0D9Y897_9ORYZ
MEKPKERLAAWISSRGRGFAAATSAAPHLATPPPLSAVKLSSAPNHLPPMKVSVPSAKLSSPRPPPPLVQVPPPQFENVLWIHCRRRRDEQLVYSHSRALNDMRSHRFLGKQSAGTLDCCGHAPPRIPVPPPHPHCQRRERRLGDDNTIPIAIATPSPMPHWETA